MRIYQLPCVLITTLITLSLSPVIHADESIGAGMSFDEKETLVPDRDALQVSSGEGTVERGRLLPRLNIDAGGEFYLGSDRIANRPWSSECFENKGKLQLVQYVAANGKATRQNKPFNDALISRDISSDLLDTTVILHMADTMGLFRGLVVKKITKNKEIYKSINFVLDDHGVGLERWGMKHKSSAIIVLDAEGKVLFAKDGPLTSSEVEQTINLIESHLG